MNSNKQLLNKTNKVVNEIETILQLAKKGRKRLNPKDIERCSSIDAKKLWGLIRDWIEGCKIPIDVIRLIFQNMSATNYWKCGVRLCKKMNSYVKDDLAIVKVEIDYTVSKSVKAGCSSTKYTYKSVIFIQDYLANKKMDLLFQPKYGCIDKLKRKYGETYFTYSGTIKMIRISILYSTHDKKDYLYVGNCVGKYVGDCAGNKCGVSSCKVVTYWVPDYNTTNDEAKIYEDANENDRFSHLIVTLF